MSAEYTMLSPDDPLPVPEDVACCPYCQAAVTVRIEACTVEKTGWIASEIHVDCATEPDLETEHQAWLAWLAEHTYLPYVYALPVHLGILRWLRAHYRFVFPDEPDVKKGDGDVALST